MDDATAVGTLPSAFCLPTVSKLPHSKEVQSWSLKSMSTHTEDSKDKLHQRSLYDGIIYDETHFDRLEFGIFEVAKDFDSLTQTKLVNDRHKLYRGMHGMGRLISKSVDHDPEAMKFVQVVGVQNMGRFPGSSQSIFSVPNFLQNSHSGSSLELPYPLTKLLFLRAMSKRSPRLSTSYKPFSLS